MPMLLLDESRKTGNNSSFTATLQKKVINVSYSLSYSGFPVSASHVK